MAFEQLKQAHSVIWGSGPFEEIERSVAPMHEELVGRLGPQQGERWLDVGCGTGGVAMRAARAGADVTGIDIAPALLETARGRAVEEGLEISYEAGDAEDLPYDDASFTVVSSSVGAMFAPDHAAAADQLARVCEPGGRLGFTAWRPDGRIGDFFRFLRSFQPPPAEGAGNPLDWGREAHVGELLGEHFDLDFAELDCPYEADSPEAAWDVFSRAFGPLRFLVDAMPDEKVAEIRGGFIAMMREDCTDDGRVHQSRTYLLTTGTRR